MYGTAPLELVLGEVAKIGANAIDVWPRQHANHREQIDQLGHDTVDHMLKRHGVKLAMTTRYDLGPYRLRDEMKFVSRFGGDLIVCGAHKMPGDTVKAQVGAFVERMREECQVAAEHGITIGIENHGGSLLASPDSIRYFADAIDVDNLGLAMAPYHLPQDPALIAALIRHLGEKLVFFQAWQHGDGCMEPLPKERELLQMPGRGPLDFGPILKALEAIDYRGWTEIFMHPVPRGIPILETAGEVTAEINRARDYLDQCMGS